MKIDYNILWFEDDSMWRRATREPLSDFLASLGFELHTFEEESGEHLAELLSKIDSGELEVNLILMDLKLAGATGPNGMQIIEKIRDNDLFTELVFYSQSMNAELRAQSGNPEGVYFSKREELVEKAKKIINLTIKKVQDLNNMRGLVMAETSELEKRLLRNVRKLIEQGAPTVVKEKKEELHKKTVRKREEWLKGVQDLHPETDLEMLCHELEHSEKVNAANRLIGRKLKEGANENYSEHLKSLEEYTAQVVRVRNLLAHVEETRSADGKRILKSLAKDGQDFVFSDESCVKIRKDLRQHAEKLDAFYESM